MLVGLVSLVAVGLRLASSSKIAPSPPADPTEKTDTNATYLAPSAGSSKIAPSSLPPVVEAADGLLELGRQVQGSQTDSSDEEISTIKHSSSPKRRKRIADSDEDDEDEISYLRPLKKAKANKIDETLEGKKELEQNKNESTIGRKRKRTNIDLGGRKTSKKAISKKAISKKAS